MKKFSRYPELLRGSRVTDMISSGTGIALLTPQNCISMIVDVNDVVNSVFGDTDILQIIDRNINAARSSHY